jgi:hypothetical protein
MVNTTFTPNPSPSTSTPNPITAPKSTTTIAVSGLKNPPAAKLPTLKEDSPVAPPTEPKKEKEDWRTATDAKRAERAAQKAEQTKKAEASVKQLLREGKFTAAAERLGMSPTDFATYVDNARLQIPNKVEEETPEVRKAREEKELRDEIMNTKKELQEYKENTARFQFIKDKISPILQDKDRFELINGHPEKEKIETFIYDQMNKHYQETYDPTLKTGEMLDAADVAESIEQEFEKSVLAVIDQAKNVKKFQSKFGLNQKIQEDQEKLIGGNIGRFETKKVNEPTFASEDEITRQLKEKQRARMAKTHVNTYSGKESIPDELPFHMLSREEKLARLREEDERNSQ